MLTVCLLHSRCLTCLPTLDLPCILSSGLVGPTPLTACRTRSSPLPLFSLQSPPQASPASCSLFSASHPGHASKKTVCEQRGRGGSRGGGRGGASQTHLKEGLLVHCLLREVILQIARRLVRSPAILSSPPPPPQPSALPLPFTRQFCFAQEIGGSRTHIHCPPDETNGQSHRDHHDSISPEWGEQHPLHMRSLSPCLEFRTQLLSF